MIFDSSHGTVLVTIGTKHGFILAADSIQTRSGNIIHDKKQKIFKVSEFIACTITGRTEVTATDKEDHYHYDLSDELIRYAGSQKGITVQHTAEQISELFYRVIAPISEQFPEFLDDWLERSSGREAFITLITVGYHRKTQPRWFKVNFPPRWVSAEGRRTLLQPTNPEKMPFKYFGILPEGWTDVVKSLISMGEDLYPECRKLESLQRYYLRIPTGENNNTTLDEGIELAETLVKCAIEHSPPNAGVGGEVQLAVVERGKGFRWIKKLSDDWI